MSILKSYVERYGVAKLCGKAVEKLYNRDDYDEARYSEIVTGTAMNEQRGYAFVQSPLISIILPAYNTRPDYLRQTFNSVKMQTYANWQLCIADGGERKIRSIADEIFGDDARVLYKSLEENKGISANSNEALNMATGDYVTFLDHDDIMEPDALFEVVKRINDTGADMVYTDEDKVTEDLGRYFDCYRKPDFNLPLMLSNNYMCHMTVISRKILDEVGNFSSEFDGAQDYELFLRCIDAATRIEHVARVLYHWRATSSSTADTPFNKMYAYDAGKRALEKYLAGRAEVMELDDPGFFNIIPPETEGTAYMEFVVNDGAEYDETIIDKAYAYMEFFDADIIVPKITDKGRYLYNGIAACGKNHTESLKGRPSWFKGKFNLAAVNLEVGSVPRTGIFVRKSAMDKVAQVKEGHITNRKGPCKGLKMVYVPSLIVRM